MIIYKLSRPSSKDSKIELVIYVKSVQSVFEVLSGLKPEERKLVKIENIPIV